MKIKVYCLILAFVLIMGCSQQKNVVDISENLTQQNSDNLSQYNDSIEEEIVVPESDEVVKEVKKETHLSEAKPVETAIPMMEIDSWVIQLFDYDIDSLLSENADLYVLEYENAEKEGIFPGSFDDAYVMAYLNIGEGMNELDYWGRAWKAGNPDWVDRRMDGEFRNYRVHYWRSEWIEIMFDRLEKIISKGYDGVYLDGLDAYEYYSHFSSVQSSGAMSAFVISLSTHAKKLNPEFKVFVQGGMELSIYPGFLDAIDGYAGENVWYDLSVMHNDIDIKDELDKMDELRKSKIVLVLDYPAYKGKACKLIEKAREHDFVAYPAARMLDKATNWGC